MSKLYCDAHYLLNQPKQQHPCIFFLLLHITAFIATNLTAQVMLRKASQIHNPEHHFSPTVCYNYDAKQKHKVSIYIREYITHNKRKVMDLDSSILSFRKARATER